MFKVVIAGSRDFKDYELLRRKLIFLFQNYKYEDIEIVSGGARGADTLGERFAKEYGCKLTVFIPDWDKFGKSAGYIRNSEMAKYSDACVAFWNGESRGTNHMINLAKKEGLKLSVIKYQGE